MTGAEREGRPAETAGTFSWMALARLLGGRRRTIATWAFAAAVGAALVLLVVPESYRARATLLPPRNDEAPGLAAMLSTAGTPMLGFGSSNVSSEIFVEILRSRSMADAVIDSLGLVAEYGFTRLGTEAARDAARRRLQSRTSVGNTINGVVSIEVEHRTGLFPRFRPGLRRRTAERAAGIANAYVRELDRVNVAKNTSGARSARLYLEEQLAQARDEQARMARELVGFQSRHGAIELEEQTRLTLEAAGRIEGQIQEKRVELELVRRTDSDQSPRVRALRAAVDALARERDQLLGARDAAGDRAGGRAADATPEGRESADRSGMIPARELPELLLRYTELLRELKAKELLIEMLTQRFYEARLDESRLTPVVEVLDDAIPPVAKSAPKRTMLVLLAAILGSMAGMLRVMAGEGAALLSPPGERRR